MKAFHGDPAIKAKYMERVEAHEKADEIIKNLYWEEGKGCAVGCTIHSDHHAAYETELGIPRGLAYLQDVLFEELPNGHAKKFPARFLHAIPVGADLSTIVPKFVIWQFESQPHGLKHLKVVQADKKVYSFCEEVVALYRRKLNGERVVADEFYKLYLEIDWVAAWAWAGARVWATGAGVRVWATWAGARAGKTYDNRIMLQANHLIVLLKQAQVTA